MGALASRMGLGLASALLLGSVSPLLAPLLVDVVRPRLPLVLKGEAAPGPPKLHPCIFAMSASEISKLAVTFCTSSLSSSALISRRIFSPASSSTATVL